LTEIFKKNQGCPVFWPTQGASGLWKCHPSWTSAINISSASVDYERALSTTCVRRITSHDSLWSLNWLCLLVRLQFKVSVLMYKALHGPDPSQL